MSNSFSRTKCSSSNTKKHRIAFVSSFPPTKCGVANYSDKLFQELNDSVEIILLADIPEHTNHITNSNNKQRIWRRNSIQYVYSIFKNIVTKKINTAHIQHEYLLYGEPYYSGFFPILLLLLQIARRRVVVTMHSVVPLNSLNSVFFDKYGIGKNWSALKRISTLIVTKLIGMFSDKIIVHNSISKKILINEYGFDSKKLVIIPHGVEKYDIGFSKEAAKQDLQLTDYKVVLFFGFIKPGKGLQYLLKAIPKLVQKDSRIKLVVAGGTHPNLNGQTFRHFRDIEKMIEELKIKSNIILTKNYISEDLMKKYISASDVCVMPYTQNEIISASGVLNAFISFGKPIVATSVYQTGDLINEVNALVVNPRDSEALFRAISRLISEPILRKKLTSSLKEIAKNNDWKKIADKTIGLYKELDNEKQSPVKERAQTKSEK